MTEREKTTDVLGKLLGGGPPPEKPEEKAPPVRLPAIKPAELQPSRTASQRAKKPPVLPISDKKAKVTYYLSPETLDALEAGWLQLRRLASYDRAKISKSLIVEASLLMALEELKDNAETSQLAIMLVCQ
jgi:hypothetical protein